MRSRRSRPQNTRNPTPEKIHVETTEEQKGFLPNQFKRFCGIFKGTEKEASPKYKESVQCTWLLVFVKYREFSFASTRNLF